MTIRMFLAVAFVLLLDSVASAELRGNTPNVGDQIAKNLFHPVMRGEGMDHLLARLQVHDPGLHAQFARHSLGQVQHRVGLVRPDVENAIDRGCAEDQSPFSRGDGRGLFVDRGLRCTRW